MIDENLVALATIMLFFATKILAYFINVQNIYLDWKEKIITIHDLLVQKIQNKIYSAKDMSIITQY